MTSKSPKRRQDKAWWCFRHFVTGPYLCLCMNEAQFRHVMRWLKVPKADWPEMFTTPQADATVHFMKNPEDLDRVAIFCLRTPNKSLIKIVGLFAHEATHIVERQMQYIGEEQPSEEFRAYSVQNVTQALFTAYMQACGKKTLNLWPK